MRKTCKSLTVQRMERNLKRLQHLKMESKRALATQKNKTESTNPNVPTHITKCQIFFFYACSGSSSMGMGHASLLE